MVIFPFTISGFYLIIVVMAETVYTTENYDLTCATECIKNKKPFEYVLSGPSQKSREFIKNVALEYLRTIGKEKFYNLLCLCIEEVISNSVKANIKRAYFLSNNLDTSNPSDYEKGMKNFKEAGMGKVKDPNLVKKVNSLGLYVKMIFKLQDNTFYITTHNNSVISKEELERINKKLSLSQNQTPEQMFLTSIDTTEGAGLGIIMIKKILSQISSAPDCFSIRATNTETITELKITRD